VGVKKKVVEGKFQEGLYIASVSCSVINSEGKGEGKPAFLHFCIRFLREERMKYEEGEGA